MIKKIKITLVIILILQSQLTDVRAYDPALVDAHHYSLNEGDKIVYYMNFSVPLVEKGFEFKSGLLEVTAKVDMRTIKQPYEDGRARNIEMNDYLEYNLNRENIPDNVTSDLDELLLFPIDITLRDRLTKLSLIEFYQSLNYSIGIDFEIDEGKLLYPGVDGSYIVDIDTGIVLEYSSSIKEDSELNISFVGLIRANTNSDGSPVNNIETITESQVVTQFTSANLPFAFLSGIFGLLFIPMYWLLREKKKDDN